MSLFYHYLVDHIIKMDDVNSTMNIIFIDDGLYLLLGLLHLRRLLFVGRFILLALSFSISAIHHLICEFRNLLRYMGHLRYLIFDVTYQAIIFNV